MQINYNGNPGDQATGIIIKKIKIRSKYFL
jgi:hypothetical protein